MNTDRETREKLRAFLLLLFGIFGILIVVWRLTCYQFQYDPKHYPVDYGAYNVLSYFTLQSNIFSSVYLFLYQYFKLNKIHTITYVLHRFCKLQIYDFFLIVNSDW